MEKNLDYVLILEKSSNNLKTTKEGGEYFPSVAGLKIIDHSLSENLPINDSRTEQIIQMLKDIDVDGETMEYILEKVAMTNQMLRQLVMNNPQSDIMDLLLEKVELDDERLGLANN